MTILYRCDAPDCHREPTTYARRTLTHSWEEAVLGPLQTTYHFCNGECMVAFMNATKARWSTVLGHSVIWPGKTREDSAGNTGYTEDAQEAAG